MFVNMSNYNSSRWSEKQRLAARELGGDLIIDLPFPMVSVGATDEEIAVIAQHAIANLPVITGNDCVHVMGDRRITRHIVQHMLSNLKASCVFSTSKRKDTEVCGQKTSEFEFDRFFPYYIRSSDDAGH